MDNVFSQPTDQDALNLTHAIALQESGSGGKPNYNATGDNGTSTGAYQWQPGNFAAAATKYGLDPTDMSPQNQDKVAYAQVKSMKDQGLQPWQIASAWNSGSPDNWQNHSGDTVINGKSIHYDTPAYVNGVKNYYLQLSKGQSPTTSTSNADATTPDDTQPDNTITPGNGLLGKVGNAIAPLATDAGQTLTLGKNENLYEQALQQNTDLQTRIREAILTKQKAGGDTTRLQNALQMAIADTPKQADFTGTLKTGEQIAGDAAQTGINVLGATDLAGAIPGKAILGSAEAATEAGTAATQTLGQKVATGAGIGAAYGAATGGASGMQNNSNVGGVAVSGLEGAGLGAATGAATEGLIAGGSALLKSFGSKTADEIATMARDPNVTQKDINSLSAKEQEQFFKEKASAVSEDAKTQRAARTAEAQASVQQADQEVKAFQQQAGEAASTQAESLKEPAQNLLKDQSTRYVQLTQEAAAQAGSNALEKTVAPEDLSKSIDDTFADTDTKDNSDIRSSLKSDLGLNASIDTEEEQTITNQDLLDKAKEIMQTVSKSARSGGSVYSPDEYQAMQKYSFIMDQLGKNGVDMTEANTFWKNWAPTRDRIVREIKPWDAAGVKGSPFSKTLIRASNTGGTALQTASKIDAQKFVSELETRLGVPKGSLGKDVSDALQGADKSKLNKETAQEILSEAKDKIAKDKAEALKTMSRQKYTAASKARNRTIIKGIVAGVLGLEALKKVPEAVNAAAGLL